MQIEPDLSPSALMRRYEAAAGKAAVIELKLRILTEIVPELEVYAHDFPFKQQHVVDWFAGNGDPLTADEVTTLGISNTFRNKYLHGDLRLARSRMQQLGAQARRSGGHLISLDIAAGNLLGQIDAALVNETMTPVADTKTEDSGIGAWLLEFALTGDFEQAVAVFARTSVLIDALMTRAEAIMVKRRPAKP
jgi:hypothetical protein